ncbi:Cysteine protease [Rhynchospora pubera]|uniref:Cysteine protease n=1 Tax=Rhynchospora pubera TaxID=906938 RepID=A0AAV8DIR7_9POAL|nr:Cysteine protease [Rhynchospora pubera]
MAKSISVIAIILALSAIRSTSKTLTERDLETEESLKNLFEKWVAHHGLEGDLDDKAERFSVFKHNVKYIHEFNKHGHSYDLGLNQFGEMTNEDFRNMYAGGKIDRRRIRGRFINKNILKSDISLPPYVNWIEKGAVNPIKNQKSCNCSGIFSAIASVESILFIRNVTKTLLSLSEQELVDCGLFSYGCDEGSVKGAFLDILTMGGLTTESAYPYTGQQGICQYNIPVAKIDGFENVAPNNETELTIAVYNQPVIEGIFNTSCGFNPTHAVTVVGYCATYGICNYWIVRNSWGEHWGEGGYIKMQRGFSDPRGLCGINMEPYYPTKMPFPATSSIDDSYANE